VTSRRLLLCVSACAALAAGLGSSTAHAATAPTALPSANPPDAQRLSDERLVTRWAFPARTAHVFARPSRRAHRVARLRMLTEDRFPEVYLLLARWIDPASGATWVRLRIPGRPNGRTGWVPAAALSLTPVYREIIIHRGTRTLELRDRGRLLLRTKVAVGAPGMETPLGTYYIVWGFKPPDPFLGVWAFATSAYSKLSEWPGGGIVGIHGTSVPQYLGQAVSHGCVRVSNSAVLVLKRYVRPGTPIRILR
jgi:lipoprotein-anchoring transpeptidase ErfK/SrfK